MHNTITRWAAIKSGKSARRRDLATSDDFMPEVYRRERRGSIDLESPEAAEQLGRSLGIM